MSFERWNEVVFQSLCKDGYAPTATHIRAAYLELDRLQVLVDAGRDDRDRLLLALVRATQQGCQRFGMENKPTLFHCFMSAWEMAFPLLVEFGVATEDESGVEILIDDAKVDALEQALVAQKGESRG